jgi:hypothetical protein
MRTAIEKLGRPRLVLSAVIAFATFQLARTGVNYFIAFDRTGGVSSIFEFGTHRETSNRYLRSDALYQALIERQVHRAFAEYDLYYQLAFYDLPNRKLSTVEQDRLPLTAPLQEGDAVVLYESGFNKLQREGLSDLQPIASPPKFLVLKPAPRAE